MTSAMPNPDNNEIEKLSTEDSSRDINDPKTFRRDAGGSFSSSGLQNMGTYL